MSYIFEKWQKFPALSTNIFVETENLVVIAETREIPGVNQDIAVGNRLQNLV